MPLLQGSLLVFLLLFSLTWVTAPAYAQTATLTPRQVVEYALTLEKLEADFYRRAIAEAQTGRLSSAPEIAKAALVSYGQDEAQHVVNLSAVLRSLGGNPDSVQLPANPNYSAILGRDPFANPTDLLLAGQYVEDLGVAAYKGQVQNLLAAGEAGKAVLAGALEIHSVEARHAAGIRYLRQTLLGAKVRPWINDPKSVIYNEARGGSPIPFGSAAFDGYATESEVLALVKPILTSQQSNAAPASSTESGNMQMGSTVQGLW
ncbi:MAG: hypothetical protein C4288_02425 [Leptolyngbya sp. ERB_1_1]